MILHMKSSVSYSFHIDRSYQNQPMEQKIYYFVFYFQMQKGRFHLLYQMSGKSF